MGGLGLSSLSSSGSSSGLHGHRVMPVLLDRTLSPTLTGMPMGSLSGSLVVMLRYAPRYVTHHVMLRATLCYASCYVTHHVTQIDPTTTLHIFTHL